MLIAAGVVWSSVGLVLVRFSFGRLRAGRVARRLGTAGRGDDAASVFGGRVVAAAGLAVAPMVARAGIDVSVSAAGLGWLASTGAGLLVGFGLDGALGAAVGSVVGAAAPVVSVFALRGRSDIVVARALPDALEAIGRSVRSGASMLQAIDEARSSVSSPLVAELELVLASVRLGSPLSVALDGLVDRRPLPVVRLAAAALVFSAESGGLRSQAIDGLAASLRDRVAVEREIQALSSQTRFSAMIIAVLPVGFVLFSGATDPRIAGFLTGTNLGRVCLVVGLGLDVVGLLWMRHLTGAVS